FEKSVRIFGREPAFFRLGFLNVHAPFGTTHYHTLWNISRDFGSIYQKSCNYTCQKRGYQSAIFAPKQQSGIIAGSSPQIFNFRRLSLQSAVAECCQ
ncbi:MAG: hypothetical protein II227_02945, partial [Clostridia bacterium]|nr:hypothetical protein [Clostridia bacterium]